MSRVQVVSRANAPARAPRHPPHERAGAPNKSTTVRTEQRRTGLALHAVRAAFRLGGAVAPGAAAVWAERLFTTPPRHRPPERERDFLATGERADIPFGARTLAAWTWGSGPRVLLVHGWAGRAGQFSSFVPRLVRAGYCAVAFDAPGHGASAGRRSSLPEFAAAVHVAERVSGRFHAMVGHSMGAAAIAIALRDGVQAQRVLFLAPPADPAAFVHQFARQLAISDATLQAMRDRIARRLRMSWSTFHVPSIARALAAPPPLLVFHDWADDEIPESDGRAIADAWPGSTFVSTAGLSHRRVLHYPEVVERGVAWLAE